MKLSIEEKIGQRFIFGVNNDNIDSIVNLIKNNYIGGVILYKKNYNSYNEMLAVIKIVKEANKNNKIPLFISIDQENGRVNRLPKEIRIIKNNYDVSKQGINFVRKSANITARILKNIGVNMNFAPVLDINNNSNSKALYKRCFSGSLDMIEKCGRVYINEFKDNGVISVVKHYPGHGASVFDSHIMTPYIFNYRKVLDMHMRPFDKIINDECDALMIGHLVIRRLTGWLPASISNGFMKKYLRDKVKFNGLIITDEINMLRRTIFYSLCYLKRALCSCSDIVLIKIKNENEGLTIINKYKKLIVKNDKYKKNLDDSVTRILDLKERYCLNDNVDIKLDIDSINKEIDELNDEISSN